MNRRDTIIIGVLLNAALLAILFITATHNEQDINPIEAPAIVKEEIPQEQEILITSTEEQTIQHPVDEIDSVLKQFASNPHLILVDEDNETIEKDLPKQEIKQIVDNTTTTNDSSQLVNITVKKGDALEKIARANNTTVEAIKKVNNLKNNKLNIGQQLKVPVDTKKIATAPKLDKVISSNSEEYYTIKSGDNPWKVAKQFNVKFDDLLKLNNLDEERARNLKIGDKIRVK